MKAVVAWLVCASIASAAAAKTERIGMAWRTLPSPDGASLVYIAEHRVDDESEYSLTLKTDIEAGIPTLTYSLTPRYAQVVDAPSGEAVAYLAVDFTNWWAVYVYGDALAWPHPYPAIQPGSNVRGHRVQWSTDSAHVRCRISRSIGVSLPKWRVGTVGGALVMPRAATEIEWAEPAETTEPPEFMSQQQPAVSRGMPMAWQADSQALYVADGEGVWRVTLGEPFMPMWDMVYATEHTQALAMSPSGEFLVVEAGVGGEREIHELWLRPEGVETRLVRGGWEPAFAPEDDVYYFGSQEGFYVVRVGADPILLVPLAVNTDGF